MTATITLFYASLIALWYLVLSVRVIVYRRKNLVEIGEGDSRKMAFLIRAQGNLIEYAPIALILLFLIELQGVSAWVVHGLGLLLLAGRLSHGWSFSFALGMMKARVLGMALTLTMIGVSAILGLVLVAI